MQSKTSSGAAKDWSGLVVGVLLLVLAAVLWLDALRIGGVVSYGIGPTVAPKIIAGGLVLLGILSIISSLRSTGPLELEPMNWKPVGLIIVGFMAMTALIGFGAGFIIAVVVLFTLTSVAFGRRSYLVDIALGSVLAVSIYLVFSKLLTLSLPQGPLEKLIG